MSIDKKLEYIKLLDKFSETFGESEEQTPDEVREELREEGVDIDSAETEMMKFQQKLASESKMQVLDDAKRQREMLTARPKEIIDEIKSWTKDQMIARIKDFADSDPELIVAYREYESGKEGDIERIRAMLTDIIITKIFPEKDENEFE